MVSDPSWRGLKDVVYTLLIGRAKQLPDMTLGDDNDRRLVRLLSKLRPPQENPSMLLGAVFDVGYDLGRHVYSKRILHDTLEYALSVLGSELQESGIGTLKTENVFHRSAELSYVPTEAAEAADAEVADAFVAGVVQGAVEETFNSQVEISMQAAHRFVVRVTKGRDVNQEARADG